MTETIHLTKEFAECLISASKFAMIDSPRDNALRYVSISRIDGGHEICGTDGMSLASYKIKEDNINSHNVFVEGYADFTGIKIKKDARVTSATTASISGMKGILINFLVGKKGEHVFVPVVQGINYPRYQDILKYDKHFLGTNKCYGKWTVDPIKFYKILSCLNLKVVEMISFIPAEESPYALRCEVYADNIKNLIAGVFNIPGATKVREVILDTDGVMKQMDAPRYFNSEYITRIVQEACNVCKSDIQFNMAGVLDPLHIEGYSPGSSNANFRQNIYAHYLIMPMNRG